MDDLLVSGNNNQFVDSFIQALVTRFSLKDIGTPHYFLGVELILTKYGLFISQHKFIHDILKRLTSYQMFDMAAAKPSSTPLSSTTKLSLHDGSSAIDATCYHQAIGALQYLNMTRLDLSFAINKLFQFMHKPNQTHLQHLKRLLCYLKSSINYGIHLQTPISLDLVTYTNDDWGSNSNDGTSTSGYIVLLGRNP